MTEGLPPLCGPHGHDPSKPCWTESCWTACARLRRVVDAMLSPVRGRTFPPEDGPPAQAVD